MIIRDDRDIVSDHERSNEQEDLPSVSASKVSIAQLVQGDVFKAQRALNMQVKSEGNDQQETIFHWRCLVNRKVYSVIINEGICTNVANALLVDRVWLTCKPHLSPYKLH